MRAAYCSIFPYVFFEGIRLNIPVNFLSLFNNFGVLERQKKNDSSAFINRAATICYIVAFIASNLIILFNQFDNVKHCYYFLISIDAISLAISWGSYVLYRLKRISLKYSTAILSYTIFTNILISNFYLHYQSVGIANNFLTSTIIFCINILVVGFCSGRIHLFISAAYYILSFLLLLYITHDRYLTENVFTLVISVVSFSVGLSAFLNLLKKIHKEELELKQELHEKESLLIREQAEKLQLELEVKQKELTTKALYILKQVENNNLFISKLNEIKKDIIPSGLAPFERILNEHQVIHYNFYWKEFETYFQKVHIGFLNNLQNNFPDLTSAERRLAAFVRLNLSTKQIADITFNSIHSIEVSRSRLRKKLNLNSQTNLNDFLNKL